MCCNPQELSIYVEIKISCLATDLNAAAYEQLVMVIVMATLKLR